MRAWVAAVLGLVAAAAVPAGAGPGDPCAAHATRVWLVRHQPGGPRRLTLTVPWLPRTDESMVWAIATTKAGGRRAVVDRGDASAGVLGGVLSGVPTAYTNVTGATVRTPGAPVAPLCDAYPRGDVVATVLDADVATAWEYVVTTHDNDGVPAVSAGWTLTPVSGGAWHFVTSAGAGTGAVAGPVAVDHFTGTGDVAGGRWGSFAFADLPCDQPVTANRNTGYGEGELHGGDGDATPRRHITCGFPVNHTVAAASKATLWRFTGDATGVLDLPVRLAVFDLPR